MKLESWDDELQVPSVVDASDFAGWLIRLSEFAEALDGFGIRFDISVTLQTEHGQGHRIARFTSGEARRRVGMGSDTLTRSQKV